MSDENEGFYDPLSGGSPPPKKKTLMPWDPGYKEPGPGHEALLAQLKDAADDEGVDLTPKVLALLTKAAKDAVSGKKVPGVKFGDGGIWEIEIEALLDSNYGEGVEGNDEPDIVVGGIAPPGLSPEAKKIYLQLVEHYNEDTSASLVKSDALKLKEIAEEIEQGGDCVEWVDYDEEDKKVTYVDFDEILPSRISGDDDPNPYDPDAPVDLGHDDQGNKIQATHVIDRDIREAPMYRDGISTTGTYLILATKTNDVDTYNCICQGNDKIKFYPNKEYFGITEEDLEGVGINLHDTLRHHGYERFMCSRAKAVKLLTIVGTTRGTITMSAQMALDAPRTGKHKSPRRGDNAVADDDD
jgi:hypothetical protein